MSRSRALRRSGRWLGTIAVGVALAAQQAAATGVTPYAPLSQSPMVERDLERVMVLGGHAVIRRPIPLGAVAAALPRACRRDHALCARVRAYLDRVEHGGLAQADVELALAHLEKSADPVPTLPDRHGLALDGKGQASATSVVQPAEHLLASAGAVIDQDHRKPTGTYLSAGWDWLQVDAGWRDHWLSPFTDGSALIGTEAPTMPSLSFSNWWPLTRFGFGYEAFVADMSKSSNILIGGKRYAGRPKLAGLQLSLSPVEGWSFAVNRMEQFGGGPKGTSLRDVLRAMLNPHANDNFSTGPGLVGGDVGNQVASVTSRMLFPGRIPFAAYVEYAGEDTSHASNYRLGNASLALGVDLPLLPGGYDATIEVTDWQNGWYVHHIYTDGLVNDGSAIGNWFGDWRRPKDAVFGREGMLRVGRSLAGGRYAALRYRNLADASYTGGNYRRAQDLSLEYSLPWRELRLGLSLEAGRDPFGASYARLAASADYAGAVGAAAEAALADDDQAEDESGGYELFEDVGVSRSSLRFESSDQVPDTITKSLKSVHWGFGVRRPVSEHQDLGVRLEVERPDHHTLVALRAFDYRYRYGRHLAASAFLGAARYDTGLAAYGWYLGAGLQWRDLLPYIDVGLDWRYADRMARDSLLPGDPPTTRRPDLFYTLKGPSLVVSYRY